MKHMVVVEKSESGYGAYVPDLPGCGQPERAVRRFSDSSRRRF
jgi:hypothetical protein